MIRIYNKTSLTILLLLTAVAVSKGRDIPDSTGVLHADTAYIDFGVTRPVRADLSSAAVSVIDGDDIRYSGQSQVMKALYGRVPGLLLVQNVSSPWPSSDTPDIYVRGSGSTSGNAVLVLVDGIRRDPSTVNVDEVDKVVVMKDAASLALYGIRGADGVINIITKRGGKDRLRIMGGYDFSMQTPFRVPEMASAGEYAQALNSALANDGLAPYYSEHDISALKSGTSAVIPAVDWQKEILRRYGYNHDLWVSFDGSGKNMKYYVYADYNGNRGLFNNTGRNEGYSTQSVYNALKLRTNLDLDITATTKLRANVLGSIMQHTRPSAGLDLKSMYDAPSTGFPIEHDGVFTATRLFSNPVAEMTGKGYSTTFQRMLAVDLVLEQDLSVITEGLSAYARIAYDNCADIDDNLTKSYAYYETYPVYAASGDVAGYSYTEYGTDSELAFSSGLAAQFMQTVVRAGLDYDRVVLSPSSHAGYYPGGKVMTVKLLFARGDARILGAQIVPYLPGGLGGGTFALILNDITQDRRDTEDLIENEKIASVLDLASGVAHELGNPLNSINIHLQLARRKLAKLMENCPDRQSVSDVMESVEICSQEVSRLDGIIENFLKALRPMRPNMSECDMLKPLMETLHILKAELEDLEIEVNVVKESGMLPKVFADENLLKQLYFNILRNAMEAMDGGGSITVDAREEDDCVRVSFTDTGCGMDEDGMSNLFRPHYTTKPDGNGLGMTIIHAIVRAHNGKIDIDSRPGEGTTVSVCIPRAEKRVKMLEHDDDSE